MKATDRDTRRALIEACLQLEEDGFLFGTYGNASLRVEEGLLVTPSRIAYREMEPDDLVTVSLDGRVLVGHRLPSSETSVHRRILASRPDVGAVLHTHAMHATALSCMDVPVPTIVEEQAQALGGDLPRSRYVPAGDHEGLGEAVATALGDAMAVLVANHGLVACGRDLAEARFSTQVAERVCQMHLLALSAGGATVIPEVHVRSERDRWLHKYGTRADHGPAHGTDAGGDAT